MRIVPGQTIADVDIVKVRDTLRQVKDRSFLREFLAERLDLSEDAAARLHEALVEGGFIEHDPRGPGDEVWWQLTVRGNALTNASAAKPVKRSTAERALDGLLQRVREVNDDPELVFRVDEVVVFGSFLDPDAETLGDVDVAIGLSHRYEGAELEQRSAARIRAALDSGRRFASFVDELYWPHVEVLRRLKDGSRVLSMTTTEDAVLDDVEHRTVFLRDGVQPRRP